MSDQQLRFLKVVQQNTERLTILVNDLLDLSRIEAGQVNLERLPVELQKIIEEAMEEIQRVSMTESKSLQMKIDIPADLPSVSGDPDRVRQILINLLNNAYYYTLPDGQINIQARCVGEEVQVDIRDYGCWNSAEGTGPDLRAVLPRRQPHGVCIFGHRIRSQYCSEIDPNAPRTYLGAKQRHTG